MSSLDTELAADTGVTKRDPVDDLDAVSELLLVELRDRPLSVIRSTRGQDAFMQKHLPKHAPAWIERASRAPRAAHLEILSPTTEVR